jgi:hypothetical protein
LRFYFLEELRFYTPRDTTVAALRLSRWSPSTCV